MDRGAPRKTWSCVERNRKAMGIKGEMARDRCAWGNITGGDDDDDDEKTEKKTKKRKKRETLRKKRSIRGVEQNRI